MSFYLSRRKNLNKTKAHLLGTCVVPAIKGNASRLISLKAKIPAGFKKGACYVIAVIGAGECFMEVNENNNQRLKRVKVY